MEKVNLLKTLLLLSLWMTCSFSALADTNKYRLTLSGNPATSITIGWNQVSGSSPTVYYGKTDFGTDWSRYPNSKGVSRSVSYKGMDNRFARLTNLEPNTAYYFVIRDSRGMSQRYWFKTAPDNQNERLSFIAGGDSRNNRTPRRNANKLVAKLRPHAVFFGGDMTDWGTSSQWQRWFDDWQYTIATDGQMFPIVAARGNHESSNSMLVNLFDVPSSNVYYALTFGNGLVRAYTLNTESSISGNQTTWLRNDLQDNSNTIWKMAQYHKPMRPHVRSKSEGNSQYSNWARLFYDYKVRLVVECDAHTVKSTWPVRPSTSSGSQQGFIRDNSQGTVYVGEGCWGAPLRGNDDNKTWTRNSGRFNQFKWIFIDKNRIETRTIRTDNADQVGRLSASNIFTIPSNLDIWSPSNGAVVTITKSSTPPPPPSNEVEISVPIVSGNDDVEERQNGDMYFNSSDLELVYDTYRSAGDQKVGLRFRNLNVPRNAEIVEANIQFTADETSSWTTDLTIRAEDTNDASSFSSSRRNVSNRSLTSASTNWRPSSWNSRGESGSRQRTPSLVSVVQEVISRGGWNTGNDMVFVISGAGKRTAESYEGSSSSAARLYIKYKKASSTNKIQIQNKEEVNQNLSPESSTFPNPTTGELNIRIQGVLPQEKVTIYIYAQDGRLVKSAKLTYQDALHLNVESLSKGLYIVKMQADKRIIKTSFIKE